MDKPLNNNLESHTLFNRIELSFWVIACIILASPPLKFVFRVGTHANQRYQRTPAMTQRFVWSIIGLGLGTILGWTFIIL